MISNKVMKVSVRTYEPSLEKVRRWTRLEREYITFVYCDQCWRTHVSVGCGFVPYELNHLCLIEY